MKAKYFLILLVCSLTACSLPEHYFVSKPECIESEVFTNQGAASGAVYQSQVRAILANESPESFRYFFLEFIDEGTKSYMMTNVRNETYCFDAKILVDDWSKLAGMKRVNGKGYPKELYDLKWELKTLYGQAEIRYLNMHDIID